METKVRRINMTQGVLGNSIGVFNVLIRIGFYTVSISAMGIDNMLANSRSNI